MARRQTPQHDQHDHDDDETVTSTSIGDHDSEEEEEEEDDPDAEQDRGDDHRATRDEEEEEDPDSEEEEEEEEDPADEAALRRIAGDDMDMVPRSRLNEVLEENRQLRAGSSQPRAAEIEEAPPFDLKAVTKQRNEKLLEGDIDGASELDDQIADHYRRDAAASATQAIHQVMQQEKVADAIAEIQKKYPVLNDRKVSAFDRDTLDEVVALRNVYIARGEPMHTALRKAAQRICERIPASEDRKPTDRNTLSLRDKQRAIARARGTPPAISRHGGGGKPAKAIEDLSEAQLRALPEAKFRGMSDREKAEARGDYVGPSSRKRRE